MKCPTPFLTLALLLTANISFAGTCPSLSGEYIIGKSANADFSTIQEASDALNCRGINSPVTFHLESGIYNEKINLSHISGVSALNTIVFASKSGEKSDVIVSNQSSDATIVLNGTSYVSFENITVEHNKATFGNCLRAEGKASHLVFRNVILDGVESAVTGIASAVAYFSSGASKTDIAFIDCELNNGSIGIYKSGINENERDSRTVLSGNLFFNQQQAGIALSNEDAPEITNNVVSTISSSEIYRGITLINAANQIMITKNVINAPNGAVGLALTDCNAKESSLGQITNNSIVAGGSGISINGSTDNQILNFNRVKLSITGGNKAYYANSGTGNNINMMNNIFFDMKTGGYTVLGNSYKDFFNQLPGQGNSETTASANVISIEKVSPLK